VYNFQLVSDIFEANPDLTYLKNVKIHFIPLVKIKRIIGIYIPFFDKIFLLGNPNEGLFTFAVTHELDHCHYWHQNGMFSYLYHTIFYRSTFERRAVKRSISTIEKLCEKYTEVAEYKRRFKPMVDKLKFSKNPFKRFLYKMYYEDIEL
jgi:hypothetical protein